MMFLVLTGTTHKLYSQGSEFIVPDGDCSGYCTSVIGNCPILVCNSSFQFISAAPDLGDSEILDSDEFGGILDLDFSCAWQNVQILQQGTTNNFWSHAGTPDVFSPGYPNGQGSGVPLNARGIQNDHTSNNNSSGYIGIYTFRNVSPTPGWREYAALRQPLQMQAGQTYQISFWVSLGEVSTKATSIQVYIGQNIPLLPANQVSNYHEALTMLTPVYTSPTVTNSVGWTPLSFNFTPNTSGSYYLIIGNFRDNANTPLTNITTANVQGVTKENAAYYYIDDVVIKNTLPDDCCNFDHVLGDPLYGNSTNLSNIVILPGQRVLLLGTIQVDQSISLLNNDMVMGPDAELNLEPGVSLSAINTKFRGCEYMWMGINANYSNNSIALTRCTVQDAVNGLKLSGGGLLSLSNSNFINNHISLQLKDFSGVWPLQQFRANTFRQVGNFKGLYPDPSPAYAQPYQHIQLTNVGWISLVAPPGMNNRNRFLHAQTGIYADRAGLTVSNAAFQLIRVLSGNSNNSWAIDARNGGVGNTSSLYGLKVNNQWGPVQFQQCDNGIRVQGSYYSEIYNNSFWQLKGTAFYQLNTTAWPWWNNTTAQIDFKQNQINNVLIGVDLYNIGFTHARITDNTITNTPYRDKSVAIRAQNLKSVFDRCRGGGLHILNNETNRFETGISVDFFACPRIQNNAVSLLNPNWDQAHGIWVRSCLRPTIGYNTVQGTAKAWYSQGIRLEFSPQTTISCNYVNNTENALWIHNNNNFSAIIGNTLMNYKYGLHLTYNGLIGSQLITGTEKYDLFNSFDLTQGGPDVDLFTSLSTFGPNSPFCFRNSIFSDVVSGSLDFSPISKEIANNLSLQNFCGTATQPFNSNYPIIAGVYANENRWITKFKYAQVLKASADSVSQLFNNPYMINQVNDSINTTVAKDILELDSLIEQKYWNEAWSKIYSTNPTHPIEELNLSTSEIVLKYLPVLWNGQDTTINSVDVNWLFDVANRCPYQWGEVVFQARIFIHRYIHADTLFMDNCLPYAPNAPRLMQPEVDGEVYVYPNPATEVLYVYKGNNEAFDYMIHDVQGRIVKQEAMKQLGEIISIEGLQAGCYYITLNDGTIHKTLPFVKN
jgi:hypothetical protein